MRTTIFVFAFILSISGLSAGQELVEYQSIPDGFKITLTGQPTITDTTWTSQQGYMLPARVYRVDKGREHYSVTVIDYSGIEQIAIEHVKTCPAGAPLCKGTDISGPGLWKHDVRQALMFATFKFMQRDAKVTELTWTQLDLVEGNQIQLLNADQSRTYAYVTMHEMKLYITEATVPKGNPPATLFQTSLGWVDKDGNGIRYQTVYSNEFHGMRLYPVPPLAGAAGGGRAAGAGPQGREGGAGGR
jgi:hypothetical protein